MHFPHIYWRSVQIETNIIIWGKSTQNIATLPNGSTTLYIWYILEFYEVLEGFLYTIPWGRNFSMCGGREILFFNSDFSEFAWFNMGEVRDLPECEIALILVNVQGMGCPGANVFQNLESF